MHSNIRNRLFSLLLTFAMLFALFPTSALAADSGAQLPDNWENCTACSAENPHLISTKEDLNKFRTHLNHQSPGSNDTYLTDVNGYFKLTGDLTFNPNETFEPIGVLGKPDGNGSTVSQAFTGTFDGDGHKITGLTIRDANGEYGTCIALFGRVRNGTIKNLTLENCSFGATYSNAVSDNVYVGALAGFAFNSGLISYTGEISNCNIVNCNISLNVPSSQAKGVNAGGVFGRLQTMTVSNCLVTGSSVDCSNKAGGICGESAGGTIQNCAVQDSTITGTTVGGIIGSANSTSFKISDSYAKCRIALKDSLIQIPNNAYFVGGCAGQTYKNCTFNDCIIFATIDLSSAKQGGLYVGGLLGRDAGRLEGDDLNVADTYWNVKILNEPSESSDINKFIADVATFSSSSYVPFTYQNCSYIDNERYSAYFIDGTATAPTISAIPTKIELTYGEKSDVQSVLKELPENIQCNTTDASIISVESDRTIIPRGVGEGKISVVIKYGDTQKCDFVVIPVAVKAKEINVTMSDSTVAYDGTAKTITATVDSSSNLPSGLLVYSYKKSDADDSTYTTTPPTDAGTYTVKVTPSNPNYKLTGTLTATLEVTPIQIIYGAPGNTQDGRPYITYALNEDGTAPTLSELLKFYPVKKGSQDVPFEADISKQEIILTPGMGPDGDVYYKYQNKGGGASGNIIETGTLPTHLTTDAEGTPHSIQVDLKLKNPNYRFCTVGTGWEPADTITLYVTCYEKDMVEVDMYLEGDTAPLVTFDNRHEYEYTGEGIVPTERNLTSLYTKDDSITQFTAHFHAVKEGTAFSGTHLYNQRNSQLTADALKKIAPTELGVYSFVINGYNKETKTYCYASRRYSIVKGTPKGEPTFDKASSGVALSTVMLSGSMKNAAGTEVAGKFSWNDGNVTVTRGTAYSWTFTPTDPNYNTVTGTAVVWPASSGGGSGSSNVNGSGDDVSISASGGSVTASQMESAVKKADEGAAITIKSTSSTTVTLPVGGMEKAADNDNDVRLDLRYGEITLSARAIAGMTDGISSNDKIKISITSQTSSKDETISDLLDKGAAVFDVSVTANDVEVHSFDGTLTITLTVSNLSKITDPHILHILTSGTKEYYAPDSISGNTITVKGIRNLSAFAVIPGSEVPEEQTNPFTDVYESGYYYDAVLWAVENGVTNGTSATTFGPNVTVTRAQMVTFLWRAHGSPEATGANPFTDVYESDYYYDAVQWAVANGVTTGTSATTFSPDAPVTRAQAVTFQWRAAGSLVVSGSSFDDVAADAYYVNAVTWAVANGITNGTGGNNFSPDAAVSRAQAVTFLYREQE